MITDEHPWRAIHALSPVSRMPPVCKSVLIPVGSVLSHAMKAHVPVTIPVVATCMTQTEHGSWRDCSNRTPAHEALHLRLTVYSAHAAFAPRPNTDNTTTQSTTPIQYNTDTHTHTHTHTHSLQAASHTASHASPLAPLPSQPPATQSSPSTRCWWAAAVHCPMLRSSTY